MSQSDVMTKGLEYIDITNAAATDETLVQIGYSYDGTNFTSNVPLPVGDSDIDVLTSILSEIGNDLVQATAVTQTMSSDDVSTAVNNTSQNVINMLNMNQTTIFQSITTSVAASVPAAIVGGSGTLNTAMPS